MTHTYIISRLSIGCFALVTWACHGDPIEAVDGGPEHGTGGHRAVGCEVGETRSCVGSGCQGVQWCSGDEDQWLECECSASTGGSSVGGAGGGAIAGGSAGGSAGGIGIGGYPVGPLTPDNGWVAVDSNAYGIQGPMFSYADDTTQQSMLSDFTGSNACIKGTAAQVDLSCAAADCYGMYWGAAIGFNLNQPFDPATLTVGEAMPFNASASGVTGFGFTLSGSAIPTSMRFVVDDANGQYCTPSARPLVPGANTILFEELRSECWALGGSPPDETGIIKIAWQVVTNTQSSLPFDICISDVIPLN